uniref:DEP domain-containing protein 7 n=1 Tax=Oryzias latipes TaxID=8090 RepID=A0A3P9HN40_ORYLA
MASIKERAAALKLAEKLSARLPGVSTNSDQLSSMWTSLISHLRSTVIVKRRLVHLKSHSDCFLGSEAVDVFVFPTIKGASVSRDKVVSVCQTLLECQVFESVETKVLGKIKKQHLFQDSKSALYRLDNLFLTNLWGSCSLKSYRSFAVLCPVVDEVWQEQILVRLLHLVELPVLEGVLQCTQSPSSQSPMGQTLWDCFCLCLSEDEWLCAALDCLDFLPDQLVVELNREFQTLNLPEILPISLHFHHVCMHVCFPLVKAKLEKALEAVQLCLKLLPQSNREELHRLLAFMSLAADPKGMRVDKEVVNRLAVKKSFSRAILQSRSLSKEKEDIMLVFMLSNIKEIFKTPGTLHKGVSNKLESLAQGKHPDVTGSTLHQEFSSRMYSDSTKKTTNEELWTLLNKIYLDTKMSEKEKKRLLRQFNQAHPELFNQYFGDSAVSWL